jgi:branched-chain amino acid transport system substrate-binding protein
VKFVDNVNPNVWTVGQWRDGNFVAVAAEGMSVSAEPVKKTGWEK